jgi:hypothetical protein
MAHDSLGSGQSRSAQGCQRIAAAGAWGAAVACGFPLTQWLKFSENKLLQEYRSNYKQKSWE